MRIFAAISLLIAILFSPLNAIAHTRVGPMINLEYFKRRHPEETDSLRLGAGLKISTDVFYNWGGVELAAMYSSGSDSFGTQNSVDEKNYRIRGGAILRPFQLDALLLGFRLGAQYSWIRGTYSNFANKTSQKEIANYWDPYLGLEVAVIPLSGFSIEEQFTVYYDSFYRCPVYQFSVGVNI